MASNRLEHATALARIGLCAGIGLVAGVLAAVFAPWQLAPLIGWDGLAVSFIALIWRAIWPLDAEQTSDPANRESANRPVAHVLVPGPAARSTVSAAGSVGSAPRL